MSDVNAIYKKAAAERVKIVTKYLKGREGAEIDPWEDPEFSVYHSTDRYGFIHNEALKTGTVDATQLKVELDRTQKWLKMLKNWNKYYPSEKLTRRIYKGIPDRLRGEVWARMLGVNKMDNLYALTRRIYKGIPDRLRGEVWARMLGVNKMTKEQQGVYQTMKERAHEKSAYINQIDLDVNRTYRNHIMFRDRYGTKQQALFHVLAAYSVYNSEVGYCQGMSEIAALLLMYMNEEDAFWALSQLQSNKRHGMHGFFIPGFPKLIRFQEHHDNVLRKFLPKMHKYLDRMDIYPALYAIKWFLQCFLDRTPFTITLRLWDVYMLEGERLLIAFAYTIIKLHKRRLLKMQMEDLLGFFQETLEKNFFYSDNITLEQLQISLDELRKAKMDIPPKGEENELPTLPFGLEIEPSIDQLTSKADKDSTEEHFRKNSKSGKSGSGRVRLLSQSLKSNRESLASVDSSVYETAGTDSRISLVDSGQPVRSSRTSIGDQSDVNASRHSSPAYHDVAEHFPNSPHRSYSNSPHRHAGTPQKGRSVSPQKGRSVSPQKGRKSDIPQSSTQRYSSGTGSGSNIVTSGTGTNHVNDAHTEHTSHSSAKNTDHSEHTIGNTDRVITPVESNLDGETSKNYSPSKNDNSSKNERSPKNDKSPKNDTAHRYNYDSVIPVNYDDTNADTHVRYNYDSNIPSSLSDSRIMYNQTANKSVVYVNGYDEPTSPNKVENPPPSSPSAITHTYTRRKKIEQITTPLIDRKSNPKADFQKSDSEIIYSRQLTNSSTDDLQASFDSKNYSKSFDAVIVHKPNHESNSPLKNDSHHPNNSIKMEHSGDSNTDDHVQYRNPGNENITYPSNSKSDGFISQGNDRDNYYRRLSSPTNKNAPSSPTHKTPTSPHNTRNQRNTAATSQYANSAIRNSSSPRKSPNRTNQLPPGTTTTVYDTGDRAIMRHTVL